MLTLRMYASPWRLLTTLLLLFASVPPVWADAPAVQLNQGALTLDKGQLSVLEDPLGTLDWQQALAAQRAGRFKPIPFALGQGYSTSAFWLHVRLERLPGSAEKWAFSSSPAYLDKVEYFLLQDGQLFDRLRAGDLVDDPEHDLHHRIAVVGTRLPEGGMEMLVRLETTSTSVLLIQILPWSRHEALIEGRVLGEGILIGILVVILVINLLNGIWLRRPIFFYFVAYEASMLATVLLSNGFVRDLFPHIDAYQQNLIMQLGVLCSGFLAFVFFWRLLDFPFRGKRWVNGLFIVGIMHSMVGIIFAFYGRYPEAMAFINTYVSVFPILVSVPLLLSWKRMDSEQRFRAGGLFVFGVFVVVNGLYTIGLMPVTVGTVYIAPIMILSFQLSLHFILVFSVRKSESTVRDAQRRAELSSREVALERKQRLSHEMFMAMFSHEVRTPLAVIDNSTQSLDMLEQMPDSSHERVKRYTRIRDSVQRIDQLLQMSLLRGRADLTGADVEVQEYDLGERLQAVIETFDARARQRIRWHEADELRVGLRLPASILEVLMRNLIDNALKYSPDEQPVDVSLGVDPEGWYFTVRDYGAGMNEYVRSRIFERHFRAAERESVPGLGLGLFVVKEVLDKCGGHIDVHSGNEGTRMAIRMPCAPHA
ncbi:sensor histidine kinase [Marinobacterium weihaiense]|uniref:histidine kinase n=1 Tax=Marinobacterium weihaiense TaxID=2851016 RepID=A0ABS6M9M0_9GAMM|nr:sensor histidine kinase [Marinobacterium weihaiense]MBV0932975.1 sensor histidine kinase [Marinobacterium weihaiense]